MKIRELLSGPERWTKGSFAKDAAGNVVSSLDATAVCWCLAGANIRCHKEDYGEVCTKIRDYVHNVNSTRFLTSVDWNDAPERTFEDVRKLVEELDI